MDDQLKYAKVIAALKDGWRVFRAKEYPQRPFYCAKWLEPVGLYTVNAQFYEKPIDALASLDLTPDPDVLSAEKGVPYTVDELRNALNLVLDTERESHRMWDDSFTNITFSNLSGSAKEAYIQQRYEATRKHSVAVELLEAILSRLSEGGA